MKLYKKSKLTAVLIGLMILSLSLPSCVKSTGGKEEPQTSVHSETAEQTEQQGSAPPETGDPEDLFYELSPEGDSYCVKSVNRDKYPDTEPASILIPSEYNGLPVKEISKNAFEFNTNIKYVTIENGVETIGYGAFSSCKHMKTVSIPESVTAIEANAFAKCYDLQYVVLPENCTVLESGAFSECYSLREINLPYGITEIKGYTFDYCTSLREIKLPASLTKIDVCAFEGSGLASIDIPEGVKHIGRQAFCYCSSLKTVRLPSSVTEIYQSAFNNIFLKQNESCEFYYNGTKSGFKSVRLSSKWTYYNVTVHCTDGDIITDESWIDR